MSDSLDPIDHRPPGSFVHGDSPGKNNEVSCHALLQGIFPAQGLSLGLPHCRQILYHLSNQGSPRILEWVAYPFSRGSSRPSNWTGISSIVGGFFTKRATREDIYSPWEGIKCPWLCFMAKLLPCGLFWLFSFVSACSSFSLNWFFDWSFSTDKRQVGDMGGKDHRLLVSIPVRIWRQILAHDLIREKAITTNA